MKKIFVLCLVVLSTQLCFSQMMKNGLSKADYDLLVKTHNDVTKPAHEHPQQVNWADFVKAHYADNAILLPENSPMIEGQAAIIKFFQSLPSVSKFMTTDLEIEGNGNLAFIRGSYELIMKPQGAQMVNEKGKYIEIWQKGSKGWKCIRDIFNADEAAK